MSCSSASLALASLTSSSAVPSLVNICLEKLIDLLELTDFHPHQINELCKVLSDFQHLLDPILVQLLNRKAITDVALLAFLVPDRLQLVCPEVIKIKNSTFKMIGYNCPNLVILSSPFPPSSGLSQCRRSL
jgi:hypothetical protein